jgi:opacity protein-like surface antigen
MIVMASLKATLCAGVIALGAADLAQAADLLPPPPPVEPAYAPSFSGWYIRGDVGIGINQLSGARSTLNPFNPAGGGAPLIARVETTLADVAITGVGVGYQFNNWVRFDGTAEYRTSAAYRAVNTFSAFCTNAFCQDSYTANIASGVFLANGYIDVGTWYGVTPFVGAGVGGAIHKFAGLTDLGAGSGFAPDRNMNTFAWAVMAGLGFNITPNLKLEISYRYLDMGTLTSSPISCEQLVGCFFEKQSFKLASNDVRIGFRYMFADYARPAPPLVAKY